MEKHFKKGTGLLRGTFSFPSSERVRTSDAYRRVKQCGRRRRTSHLGVNYAPNGLSYHRLGLVVQKRFWNAVHRNRIKRLLREWFRTHKHQIPPPGKDIVIIARPGMETLNSREVERELSAVLAKENGCSS